MAVPMLRTLSVKQTFFLATSRLTFAVPDPSGSAAGISLAPDSVASSFFTLAAAGAARTSAAVSDARTSIMRMGLPLRGSREELTREGAAGFDPRRRGGDRRR